MYNVKNLKSSGSLLWGKGFNLSSGDVHGIADLTQEDIGFWYVNRLVTGVEKLITIDPSRTENEILQMAAGIIVECLGAAATSVRIYDPEKKGLVSYASYPNYAEGQAEVIPFEDSIAGEVVKTHQSYLVPNISTEEKYYNKEQVAKAGFHSMLAVPLYLPSSSPEVGIEGVIQIYYNEQDKVFTPVELKIAEGIVKPLREVIALKRIDYLHKVNATKDRVSEHIYEKLAGGQGIKVKDMFTSVIQDLLGILQIQRCALLSFTEDREHITVEAGYPEARHGIGTTSSVHEIPCAQIILNGTGPFGSFENEKIYPHYILITNVKETRLLSPGIKHFLENYQVSSVLYVPLTMKEDVKYVLVFDAQSQHERFTEEDINILTFFGKELTKGVELEKRDDILHDFKNPAIAVAGFAKRVQKFLKQKDQTKVEGMDQALDIILKETCRLQDLALTLSRSGKESIVDLTEVLKRRFLINEEALNEFKMRNIRLSTQDLESPLWVQCVPLHIERVLDNLLNNASKAIPEAGGELSLRSYRNALWAVVEITNTGQMSEEEQEQFILGKNSGRGIHICTRLLKNMGGKMSVESREGKITLSIMVPYFRS